MVANFVVFRVLVSLKNGARLPINKAKNADRKFLFVETYIIGFHTDAHFAISCGSVLTSTGSAFVSPKTVQKDTKAYGVQDIKNAPGKINKI